jgi:hypothetical protein
MISQTDGARLMAAHEKAIQARALSCRIDGRNYETTIKFATALNDAMLKWDAAERAFSDLVSELTMPAGE